MQAVEKSITANVPPATAYERWLHFETFPQFMPGVLEVRRVSEKQFAWVWEIEGHRFESVSEITLQIPARRIAWRSVSGWESSGVVAFQDAEGGKTQITMSMTYHAASDVDNAETVSARLQESLQGFKEMLESSAIEDIVENNWQGF